jgi:16S rRNA (uracil1498-N3)-methyltransferase
VAIGPEGGWSPDEEQAALAQGWMAVQLGPTILRTSTAAVAAATLLVNWRQRER